MRYDSTVEFAFVLVHSPLVGPATWQPAAGVLGARGWQTCTPDLTPALAGTPPYWTRQVEAITSAASSQPSVLVGHSGAGPLLAAAGSQLHDVVAYVFVDAGLPAPGRNWMSTVPADLAAHLRSIVGTDRMLPPWPTWWDEDVLAELITDSTARRQFAAECPKLPMAMFEEILPDAPCWPDAPAAYLRLSDAYDQAAELDSHHLAPLTDADVVVDAMLGLLAALQS
jgi:pimeloyl-ACP methyl ester carboxylesterase